jgi:hypothetical protein
MKNDVLTSNATLPQSLSTSTALRQQGTSVCMPCPAHVAKFNLRESHYHHHQYKTLYCGLNHSGLQFVGNLRVLYQGCRVDGVTILTHHSSGLPESSNLSEELHYHAEAQCLLDSCEAELI